MFHLRFAHLNGTLPLLLMYRPFHLVHQKLNLPTFPYMPVSEIKITYKQRKKKYIYILFIFV